MFNQLFSLTNSYFGWQLLHSSYPSDEFGKKKNRNGESFRGTERNRSCPRISNSYDLHHKAITGLVEDIEGR
uniref:Uncharacterized protein n=1 Tax=Heterorhabditis bacteriophora TaxID=37862 RepID=A0A1I7XUG6_HETBA